MHELVILHLDCSGVSCPVASPSGNHDSEQLHVGPIFLREIYFPFFLLALLASLSMKLLWINPRIPKSDAAVNFFKM